MDVFLHRRCSISVVEIGWISVGRSQQWCRGKGSAARTSVGALYTETRRGIKTGASDLRRAAFFAPARQGMATAPQFTAADPSTPGPPKAKPLRALAVLWPYVRRYKLRALAAFAALVLAALATLTLPLAIRS
jgi:hypothetical protein